MEGCPNDLGNKKSTLSLSLIDYYDTTLEKLSLAKHVKGPQCKCKECENLRKLEDVWILKIGSFYGNSGLNERNDIKRKTRSSRQTNY